MMRKTLALMSMFVLAAVMTVGLASALTIDVVGTPTIPSSVDHDDGSFPVTFTLNSTAAGDEAFTFGVTAPFTITGSPTTIASDTEIQVTAKVSFDAHQSGNLAGTITVDITDGAFTDPTIAFNVPINKEQGLEITRVSDFGSSNTAEVNVKNTGNVDITGDITLTQSGDLAVRFPGEEVAYTISGGLDAGEDMDIDLTITASERSSLDPGQTTATITASNGSLSDSVSVSASADFCSTDYAGGLKIVDIEFNNLGRGDDEEWYPYDEIEVEVEVESNTYDMDDVELSWVLIGEDGTIIDDDKEKDVNIDEDEDEIFTFTITLDDIDDLSDGTVTLLVRAQGKLGDDPNAADEASGIEKGDTTCVEDENTDAKILIESNLVILDSIPQQIDATCGQELIFNLDAVNIGDSDQDDVEVRISSSRLGFSEDVLVGDIKEGDEEPVNFAFFIPRDIAEGSYNVHFEVFDEDGDIYEDADDDEVEYDVRVDIAGASCGTGTTGGSAGVSARVASGGNAGEDLVLDITLTNPSDDTATYTITLSGYNGWAQGASLSEPTVTVSADNTRTVQATFDVRDDAEGDQTFTIEVLSGSTVVARQPVSVRIAGSEGGFSLGENWLLWMIIALNVLLVVVIIGVIIARSGSSSRPQHRERPAPEKAKK